LKLVRGTGKVLAWIRVVPISSFRLPVYRYGTVSYRNLFPAAGGFSM